MPRHPVGAARERAVSAAGELFYARGLAGVSVDDVARAAGVSKVTVYAHFDTKDALAAAALRRQGTDLIEVITSAMAAAGRDPRARIDAAFGLLAANAATDRFRGCAFLNAAAQAPDPAHPVHEELRIHKQQVRELFRSEAAAAAHPRPDEAADELLLLLDGALTQAGVRHDPQPVAIARRLAARVLAST